MTAKARSSATTDGILLLCTSHLTKDTMEAIDVTVDYGMPILKDSGRYIIQLREAEYDAGFLPPDLRQIADYALSNGCGWIALYEFFAVNPDLPSYS